MAAPTDGPRAPHLEILDLKEDVMMFSLTGTDTSVANALRRHFTLLN